MITITAIRHAETILKKHVVTTPLLLSNIFSRMFHAGIYLKLENMQKTGSFKIRGATYKLHKLAKKKLDLKGVIAASAGNHAQGVALAAGSLNIPATIVMPENVSIAKQEATASYGGNVIIHGQNVGESLEKAKALAENGMIFIHPYDDEDVITGQGTIGLEILKQIRDPDLVVVPVGGGGLISGIASAIKELKPNTKIIGVQAEACPSAINALSNKGPVCQDAQPSIADGINVSKVGDIPYSILERLVDDVVLVDEEFIAAAMLLLLERKKILAEGAGAVCIAALMNRSIVPPKGGKIVLLVSGGNVDSQLLGRIVAKGLLKHGRIMRFRICLDDRPGALSELLIHVAKAKANVMTINHTRNVRGIPLGRAYIDLELETRGKEHIREVSDYLENNGYRINSSEMGAGGEYNRKEQ